MKKFTPATQVDFVIIGSGGAGGAMAKELSTSGFEVVVLEQGPRLEDKDFKHDELKIRNTPALVNDHALQPNTFRKTEQEKAQLAQFFSIVAARSWNCIRFQYLRRSFLNRTRGGKRATTAVSVSGTVVSGEPNQAACRV